MQKLKQAIKRWFPKIVYRKQLSSFARESLTRKIEALDGNDLNSLSEAGEDIFTYHGEDGIIYYLLQQLQPVNPVFVDIGSGDCIKSNCAMWAIHFNWAGLFIDNDATQLAVGKNFYKQKIKNGAAIKFVNEEARPNNINDILKKQGLTGEIGLLSIDIDGNDYWVWKAIDCIRPKLVVIEAKVEFGYRDIIVPYGKDNHHSRDKMYNGASVEALRKLGEQKGYDLAGANKYGYNLFFTRKEAGVRRASEDEILGNDETQRWFYPESFFSKYNFVTE